PSVELVGVEAAGDGLDTDRHAATLSGGSKGVLHGVRTYVLQDAHGQIQDTHSVSAGLDYPGVGPELSAWKDSVLHGVRTYVLQDEHGQIQDTHSVSAGLDYPGVGPELASWKDSNRATFLAATDAQAFEGFRALSQLEGIIPALETAHAVWGAVEVAKRLGKGKDVVLCVSGRGDKDVQSVADELPVLGPKIGWDLRNSNGQGDPFDSYALTLECNLGRNSIDVQATFDVQAIAEAQMQRILLQFEHVLQQVIEQPKMQIGDVSAFTSNDFVQLCRWNQELPTRLDRCMHDLIGTRMSSRCHMARSIASLDVLGTLGGVLNLLEDLAHCRLS
ncbi:hypothetical protein V495_01558, partial [Pseudogymnoascus sp. VKM F-4514 (FW-929)]